MTRVSVSEVKLIVALFQSSVVMGIMTSLRRAFSACVASQLPGEIVPSGLVIFSGAESAGTSNQIRALNAVMGVGSAGLGGGKTGKE